MTIYWTLRGLIPALVRLGYGLWRKRIIVVAADQKAGELKRLLENSRLFNKKHISIAAPEAEIENLNSANVILVYWNDCTDHIEEILNQKRPNSALIIYAPPQDGRVPNDVMQKLETRKHVVLCNFRGRLMNDILTTMMTVAYDKG